MRFLQPRLLVLSLALAIATGCDRPGQGPSGPDADVAAVPSGASGPEPVAPLRGPTLAEEQADGYFGQADGVPFPVPDPLPAEARPREPVDAPAPQPGPEPIDFWLGGTGTSDGRFHYPRAVTTTPDGAVFVADKTGRIQKFDPEGRLLRVVRTPGVEQGKPTALAIDAAGDLLVADTHYCRVLVYSPDLELRRHYGVPGREPGRFMMITAVQPGAGGLHYTLDYGDDIARVQVFREDGTFLRSFGSFGWEPHQLRRPMNLAVDDANQRLYVADAVNHRLAIFSFEGELLGELGGRGREPGKLMFPYDVKLDDEGRLWVAEFGNERISMLSTTGECLAVYGGPGRALGSLNTCWGVALGSADRVWALDSGQDRVIALTRAAVLSGVPR